MAVTAITYTDVVNGESGLSVRNKINDVGNSLDLLSDETKTDTEANKTSITALEDKALFIPSYDFVNNKDIVIADDIYEEIASLHLTNKEAGIYEINMSIIFSLDSAIHSAYFKSSVDNGSTYTEIRQEPKDSTDKLIKSNTIVYTQASAGPIDIIIQSKKENTSDVLTVYSITAIVERKV
jgi:hypothetical protein